jgi:hypothetical protein
MRIISGAMTLAPNALTLKHVSQHCDTTAILGHTGLAKNEEIKIYFFWKLPFEEMAATVLDKCPNFRFEKKSENFFF